MITDHPPTPFSTFRVYQYERVCLPTLLTDPQNLPVHPSSPQYRLNLLDTDGVCLFAVRGLFIQQLKINRSNGITIYACSSTEVSPPTVHNRILYAPFPRSYGGSMLLISGGCELTNGRATLTLISLSRHKTDHQLFFDYQLTYNHKHVSYQTYSNYGFECIHPFLPTVHVPKKLPAISAWGLDVHLPTGRIAISSNSKNILILQPIPGYTPNESQDIDFSDDSDLDEVNSVATMTEEEIEADADDYHHEYDQVNTVPSPPNEMQNNLSEEDHEVEGFQPQGPFLSIQHDQNIPCVAFSPCGNFIASTSIDSSLTISYVGEEKRRYGEVVVKMPDAGSPLNPCNHEMSWCVHWLGKHVVRYTSIFDPVWDEVEQQHVPSFWYKRSYLKYYHGPLKRKKDISKNSAMNNIRSQCRPYNPEDDVQSNSSGNESASTSELVECRYEDEYLLWITQTTIKLCRLRKCVVENWRKDSNNIGQLDICSELFIHLKSRYSFYEPQFRDIKFIEELQLIIVSGFSDTGILLIRVVRNNAAPHLGINKLLNRDSEVYMFVERMIPKPTPNCYVGTAVVERKDDDEKLRSYELWLLQSQGALEAWDIGKPVENSLSEELFG